MCHLWSSRKWFHQSFVAKFPPNECHSSLWPSVVSLIQYVIFITQWSFPVAQTASHPSTNLASFLAAATRASSVNLVANGYVLQPMKAHCIHWLYHFQSNTCLLFFFCLRWRLFWQLKIFIGVSLSYLSQSRQESYLIHENLGWCSLWKGYIVASPSYEGF